MRVSNVQPVLNLCKTLAANEEDIDLTCSIKDQVWEDMERKRMDPTGQTLSDITAFLKPQFKEDYINPERRSPVEEAEQDSGKSLASIVLTILSPVAEAELHNYLLMTTIDCEGIPLENPPGQLSVTEKAGQEVSVCPPQVHFPKGFFCASGNAETCQSSSLKPCKLNVLMF